MKRCHACGVEKTLECFYKSARYKDGHLGVCKRCFLARQARYKATSNADNRWLWATG
jgi:hypothetical protein